MLGVLGASPRIHPQREGLGGGWEFQGERSFQSCWDWSRGSGALVSQTPDLQKGPGLRAGAGVGWGLENERSKDSLRREEGPPSPDAPQSERPGGLSAALQVLPEPGFAGQGERWVE